jgi:foldase protein PrsA
MPTSASATPKRSPWPDPLGSIHPLVLLTVLGALLSGIDLVRRGPLWQALRDRIFPPSEAVAIVNGNLITGSQLSLATTIALATRGQASASEDEVRTAALDALIRAEVIRQAASNPASGPPPPADWLTRGIESFESGFAPGKLASLLTEESLAPETCRALLVAHLTQVHWLDQQTKGTDAESAAWFTAHASDLGDPETIRARHIFLSTVENNGPERETLIQEIHQKLTRGEATFPELAARYSEDERTKGTGGDLGFFGRHRIPADFAAPVFPLQPGRPSPPFRTAIGWHIAEVTGRRAASPARWEEQRAEVELHQRNVSKVKALEEWWKRAGRQADVSRREARPAPDEDFNPH